MNADHTTAIFMAQELYLTIGDTQFEYHHPALNSTEHDGYQQISTFSKMSSLQKIELIQTLANKFDNENNGKVWSEDGNDDIETAILNFLKENLPTE
jgi:hypothetical protein